jgi:hypothetical protein
VRIFPISTALLTLLFFYRPNGSIFEVQPENIPVPRPKIGDIVTFSYDSFARRELPVNPKICRIRTDLQWLDVLSSTEKLYFTGMSFLKLLSYLLLAKMSRLDTATTQGFTTKPIGHWTRKNMRLFLERLAKNRGMDPLVADTWYNTLRREMNEITVSNKIKV